MAKTKKVECVHDEMTHDRAETAECPPKMTVSETTKTAQERADNKMIKADVGMTKSKKSEVTEAKKDNTVAQEDKNETPEAKIETVKAEMKIKVAAHDNAATVMEVVTGAQKAPANLAASTKRMAHDETAQGRPTDDGDKTTEDGAPATNDWAKATDDLANEAEDAAGITNGQIHLSEYVAKMVKTKTTGKLDKVDAPRMAAEAANHKKTRAFMTE